MDLEGARRLVLRLVGGDRALADDLVQDVAARLVGRVLPGDAGEAAAFIRTVALNRVRDHYRALARRPKETGEAQVLEALPAAQDIEAELMQAEMSRCVAGYVETLPGRQGRALALHDLVGLDHDEVAAAMGISAGNARLLVHRGRLALRQALEKGCHLDFADPVPCEPRE